MKFNGEDVYIPAWISCHTYFFGRENSRTYISNEKKHIYIMLEGLASDMWYLLTNDTAETEFLNWAHDKNVIDEVGGFLEELAVQGLIFYKQTCKDDTDGYEVIEDYNNEEEVKFIEEMQSWLFDNGFMYSLFFELTYRCNLKCVHCYNPKDMASTELDFEMCKRVIDDAYEIGCFRMTFSGGESTLYSCFSEIAEYARSKRISVEIFTNGQMLAQNETLYRQLLSMYPYRICISLYSIDEKMHERVTAVAGSYEKTVSLITRLRKDNVNVQIKNFLLNFNCMDCIAVKEMAQEIGATSVADISLIPKIDGDKKTFQYLLDEDALFRLYTDENSPFYAGNGYEPIKEKDPDTSPCMGGFTGLCVNPSGEVVICVSMPYTVGNLYHDSIKTIWQAAINGSPESRLYGWHKITNGDFAECFHEEYCRFCKFCPGMAYLENGFLKKSDVLCTQAKAKMKAYHYLKTK